MTAWDMGESFDRSLEREEINGEWIPIAEAFIDGCGGLIVPRCPWCGRRHYHGDGEGARAAHCLVKGRQYILKVRA